MSLIYDVTVKTARLQAVINELDAHANPAYIEIGTAGMALVLATIPLSDPCATVSGTTLTFTMPKSDTSADATGTAAEARIMTGGGIAKITGLTVGTSGTDVILDSVSITATQTVTINSASIAHA